MVLQRHHRPYLSSRYGGGAPPRRPAGLQSSGAKALAVGQKHSQWGKSTRMIRAGQQCQQRRRQAQQPRRQPVHQQCRPEQRSPGRGTSVMTSGTTLRRSTVSVPPLPSPLQATRQGGAFLVLAPAPAGSCQGACQGMCECTALHCIAARMQAWHLGWRWHRSSANSRLKTDTHLYRRWQSRAQARCLPSCPAP
jgi:hypothetical protein